MSYSIEVYNAKGKVVKSLDLKKELFDDSMINSSIIHEYYLLQRANARLVNAHTKTRSEVSVSGRKLYRQKGTGNARVGDAGSPVRRKGWVAFGPRNERNYLKTMNKKTKKRALYGILTQKVKDGLMFGLDDFALKTPKTKDALAVLANISLHDVKLLVVLDKKNDIIEKSLRNIPRVKYIQSTYLNPVDLLEYDKVLFLEEALNHINA